jgi:hypothetical protein
LLRMQSKSVAFIHHLDGSYPGMLTKKLKKGHFFLSLPENTVFPITDSVADPFAFLGRGSHLPLNRFVTWPLKSLDEPPILK